VILAKPLKQRDLGRLAESKIDSKEPPNHRRNTAGTISNQQLIETKENYVDKPLNLKGKRIKMVERIVNDGLGLSATMVAHIYSEFLKSKNCFDVNEWYQGTVSAALSFLYKEKRITRIKVNGKYLYLRRVA